MPYFFLLRQRVAVSMPRVSAACCMEVVDGQYAANMDFFDLVEIDRVSQAGHFLARR